MFTGIVEEKGTFQRLVVSGDTGKIYVKANKVLEGTRLGDSIAVNGVCLTVVEFNEKEFVADVMPETLKRSNLGDLKLNDSVNLERAMSVDSRFGGHIVSGHIDGTGRIAAIKKEKNAVWFTIEAKESLLRYIVEKGSIAIDGTSLTVARVSEHQFEVSIIPHTLKETVLGDKQIGAVVNLENDIIGKYVERLLGFEKKKEEKAPTSNITMETLLRAGF